MTQTNTNETLEQKVRDGERVESVFDNSPKLLPNGYKAYQWVYPLSNGRKLVFAESPTRVSYNDDEIRSKICRENGESLFLIEEGKGARELLRMDKSFLGIFNYDSDYESKPEYHDGRTGPVEASYQAHYDILSTDEEKIVIRRKGEAHSLNFHKDKHLGAFDKILEIKLSESNLPIIDDLPVEVEDEGFFRIKYYL